MSWWVYLKDEQDNLCSVPPFIEGGTTYGEVDTTGKIIPSPNSVAEINVTYNYAIHFGDLGSDGLRSLNGLRAKYAIDTLQKVIQKLNTDRSDDYWEPTEGNARHTLEILLKWAQLCPDAIFSIS